MKPRVKGARIDIMGQADLLDPPQPLKVRMFYQLKNKAFRNADESMNRIIEDFFTFCIRKIC